MDHIEAAQTMAVEKYLLEEMAPEERDAFEEHFFSCDLCAQEVKAAAAFLDGAERTFGPEEQISVAPKSFAQPMVKPRKDWFAWLRPAFAVPAFALLLLVIGFQNLVQLPSLEKTSSAANMPALLPSAYLASGSSRGEEHVLTAKTGQPVVLLIDIPGPANAAYTAELYDAADKKVWSLAIPEDAVKESLPVQIPGSQQSGSYVLAVKATGATGPQEAARYTFTLNRQ